MIMSMKCSICKKDAVIFRKYEGRSLCRKHFLDSLDKTVRKTIRLRGLLPRGSHVACAVSGNSSSMLLLFELHKLNKMRQDLKISAIIADEGISGLRKKPIALLKKYTKEFGIPLYEISYKDIFGMTLEEALCKIRENKHKNKKDNPYICAYCRTMRYLAINKKAVELGADRIALASSMDDEIQNITAEYFGHNSCSSADFFKNNAKFTVPIIPVIKPVCEIPQDEAELFAKLKSLGTGHVECQYAKISFNSRVKEILDRLEAKHSGIKFNVLRMHQKTENALEKMGNPPNPKQNTTVW